MAILSCLVLKMEYRPHTIAIYLVGDNIEFILPHCMQFLGLCGYQGKVSQV